MQNPFIAAVALATLVAAPLAWAADETVLNIYSARGDATNEELYNNFMEASGMRVNRVENDNATTLDLLENEAGKDSVADVVLLDHLANLHAATTGGLLQETRSDTLDAAVPPSLRAATGNDRGTPWFGVAWHARIIVYDPNQADAGKVRTYAQLADDQNKGKLCMTPLDGAENLGLLAALIAHDGSQEAERWLQGVTDNLAGAATGSDADQIKAVAAGQCQVTLANHDALTRLMRSEEAADRDLARSVAVVFPNQDSWGTHIDVAGAAVAKHAPHGPAAVQFLEYLASEPGQNLYANSNDDWPVVEKLRFDNDRLDTLLNGQDDFKIDQTPLSEIAAHLDEASALARKVQARP